MCRLIANSFYFDALSCGVVYCTVCGSQHNRQEILPLLVGLPRSRDDYGEAEPRSSFNF